ncbi:hypothetical protein NQ318_019681 [Aromia moschata]|uniref:Exocyst complex component 8 n=1 Tax=Aromia moschata TaxID=1265417 RepID=A0AAV8Z519_9CUCU|nr:hypothetical protein NQ318_019681 [Aromia moschata]
MSGILKKLRRFDAYPKTLEDVRIQTFGGGILSVVSFIIMGFLFWLELVDYLTPNVTEELFVDTSRSPNIQINLDITVPKISCDSLDAMDSSGEQHLEIDHNIYKRRLDLEGRPIEEPKREDITIKTKNETEDSPKNKTECGSCYGAALDPNRCCNTCEEVREAYRERRWAIDNLENITQCKDEKFHEKLKTAFTQGCQIYGSLIVNRDTVGLATEGATMFQYYLKIVPTTYAKKDGTLIKSNQFSVTKHQKVISIMSGESGMPGIFFQYELSPLMVKYTEKERSFGHFITNVCAIIGGVYTVAGLLDTFLYHSLKLIQKKIELDVRELSQNYVGGSELQSLRNQIQGLSEETSNNLKRNVYQNYVQFIDTAKEISHLESEMYQLSHLLSEQKSLLSALSATSILEDTTPVSIERDNKADEKNLEEENKQKLATILEKSRGLQGDLLEIDPTENTSLKTVHVYLFTDGCMITTRNTNNRGLMKYVYEIMYDLSSLAVVNVRDLGNVKHAFKLLIFPDTRVFQCSSNSNKKEWLDKFDQAKKTKLAQEQQKRESIIEKSPSRSASMDSPSFNPFEEAEEETGLVHPEWFLDIPEELDVCVAQRHFEEALAFLQKAKEYINQFVAANGQPDHVMIDIQRKVEQRQNNLTEVLMKELEVNPDKSLQGGLRAARKAVRLLNQLGRSTQSCDLFLKLCSSMLKTQCKRVKREGSMTMYVRHLSSVVFTNMCHMSEEFLRAFPDSPSCASAYVVWASGELSLFTTHFAKQVFMPQTSLSTIAECVVMVRTQCERLCTYGVDLCYQLDGTLRSPLTKVLRDTRDKLIDSIKLRALDEKWRPINLHTRSSLARCLQEHVVMGLKLDSYVTGDTWLQLTTSVLAFAKVFLTFLDDCMKLKTTELMFTINETLYSVFEAQIKHNENSLRSELNQDQRHFLTKNAEFLLGTVVEVAQKKYAEAVGYECPTLAKIQKEYSALTKGVSPTSRSTKTKYSSEFL